MTKRQRLAYWKKVTADVARAADPSSAAWLDGIEWKTEDDLFGFLEFFRPNGAGLEKLFTGVVGGDEILQRLLRVYDCPKQDCEGGRVLRRSPAGSCYEAPETLVYDIGCDWFLSLEPIPSDALLLEEAFYSMACDYYIAHYLMWPLYRHATDIEEP